MENPPTVLVILHCKTQPIVLFVGKLGLIKLAPSARDPWIARSENRPVRIGPISHFLFAMNNNAIEYLLFHFLRKSFDFKLIDRVGKRTRKKNRKIISSLFGGEKSFSHFKGPSK